MDGNFPQLTPVSGRLPRWLAPALVVLPFAVIGGLFAIPLVNIVAATVRPSSFGELAAVPGIGRVVWFTLWQATVSMTAALALGVPVSYVFSTYRIAGSRLMTAAVVVPFVLPTVVAGAALNATLPDGMQRSTAAMIIGHMWINAAVVVRMLAPGWEQLSADSTGAARTLGARGWQVAWHVVLPHLRAPLAGAAGLAWLFSLMSFGIASVMGDPRNPTVEMEISRRARQLGDVDGAALLVVGQLVVLALAVIVARSIRRRTQPGNAGQTSPRLRQPIAARTNRQRVTKTATVLATCAVVVTPLAMLIVRSLRVDGSWTLIGWRWSASAGPRVNVGLDPAASLERSVWFAIIASLIASIVGASAALAIHTLERAAGKRSAIALEVATIAPIATSAVAVGLGLLITFDRAPFDWRGSWWMVPLSHSLIGIPFVARAALPTLRAIPPRNRDAAMTLGASPLRAWWTVEVRRLRRPLAAGLALAAAISLGDFGASTMLSRTGSPTAPAAIAALVGRPSAVVRARGLSLAVVLMVATITAVLAAEQLAGRRRADA